MLTKTQDSEEIIARVAALDIGKAELVCCVRVPDEDRPGRRLQEVRTYSTMTRSLLAMADWLRCLWVTRVVMEATSVDYWGQSPAHQDRNSQETRPDDKGSLGPKGPIGGGLQALGCGPSALAW